MRIKPNKFFEFQFASETLTQSVFEYSYEPPRGISSMPLAMLPLWFPVQAFLEPRMTFYQAALRTLGSYREPFRRSNFILEDQSACDDVFNELLKGMLHWAESDFGASLLPIPISIDRLLKGLAKIEDEIDAPSTKDRSYLLCKQIIESGTSMEDYDVQYLLERLISGNAIFIVKDSSQESYDAETVYALERLFDSALTGDLFGHVAVFFITDDEEHKILSDSQSFYQKILDHKVSREDQHISNHKKYSFLSFVCRACALWGSLPSRIADPLLIILTLGTLLFITLNYDSATEQIFAQSFNNPRIVIALIVLFCSIFYVAFFLGSSGSSRGSEEVRGTAVGSLYYCFFAGLSSFLMLIPSLITHQFIRYALIIITSIPFSFLFALSIISFSCAIADYIWFLASIHVTRRMDATELKRLSEYYLLTLHIAIYQAAITLPTKARQKMHLPLLLSLENNRVLPTALTMFPGISNSIIKIFTKGILRSQGELISYSSSSLLVDSMSQIKHFVTDKFLEEVVNICVTFLKTKKGIDEEQRGQLEVVLRHLCYISDMEELIIVR